MRYDCAVRCTVAPGVQGATITVEADGPDEAFSVARDAASEEFGWPWMDTEVLGCEPM